MRSRDWLTPEIREVLQSGTQADLRALVEDLHPHTAAELISGLREDEIVALMSALPTDLERDLFEYLEPDLQEQIVLGSGRQRVKQLLGALPSDMRAEFLDQLDERVRQQLLPLLAKAERDDLIRREQFEDDQVGAFLSTEFCSLRKEMTAPQAIAELRRQEPNRETIYYSYVVDEAGRLIGFVSLRDLITARDRDTVEKLMKTEVVSVRTDADQEEAARLIAEYDLLAVPVVDASNRLVGIVTYDDAADIMVEEHTEDAELMAGVTGDTEAEGYLDESVLSQIRRRGPSVWIFAAFYIFTAKVIESQVHHLSDLQKAFMPLVMAAGGTVGIQAGTLVIRALTVGGLEPRAFPFVMWKEIRVAIGLAAVLSVIVFFEGLLIGEDPWHGLLLPCAAMALAMVATVAATSLFGAAIPLLARVAGRDPAMVSAPAITALADLSGAGIYAITVHVVAR